MFEDYLQDSHSFLLLADKAASVADEQKARRYYRASIFCAYGAIEAFVNHIAASFAEADSLGPFEACFLNDETQVFSVKKGVTKRTEFHQIEDKLRLLLSKFISGFDFQSRTWVKLSEFKKLRNSLVHPRQPEDETTLEEYHKLVTASLSEIINLMNVVSEGIFKQPLRKQLLDLVPD